MNQTFRFTPFSTAVLHTTLSACLALAAASAHAATDPQLAFALEGIWQGERAATSPLAPRFITRDQKAPFRYTAPIKDAPTYTVLTDEDASLDYAGQRFSAVKSPFGRLPVIQPDNTRLLEMEAGRNRYLVMTGPGATLFSVGDWQRFGFLEVLNVTRKGAVQHYALVADAHLGERVLGRLPGSPVLNYARLVPSAWASSTEPDAFEVLLYALDGKAPKRVVGESGQPVAYTLSRDAATGAWVLAPTDATPVADAHDKAGLGFTVSTRLRAEATKTVPTAPSASATDAPPQSAR